MAPSLGDPGADRPKREAAPSPAATPMHMERMMARRGRCEFVLEVFVMAE